MQSSNLWRSGLILAGSALCAFGACDRTSAAKGTGSPRWVITSNDNKQFLDKGVLSVLPAGKVKSDTASLIDLNASPPKLVAEIEVPGSVQGPPLSAAITPDETLALIPAPMKMNPADPTKVVPDNRISVVDLTAMPPKIISTVTLPGGTEQPSGISISRDGKLALVANRNDGSIDVLSIAGRTVTFVSKVSVADLTKTPPDQKLTAMVSISPDGKLALATNDGDHRITLLKIDGTTVTRVKDFYAGIRPYSVDIASNGKFAVVGNVGYAQGDMDTMSLIDLETPPQPRTVDTVSVGLTPEGVKVAPDSSYAVAILQNGTNKAETFPFYSTKGRLVAVKIEGKTLKKASEVDIGRWCQGAVFSADSKQVLVGCMVEQDVEVFEWNGSALKDTGTRIKLNGGPAAIRTAEPPLR
jgi:DNA-binding beta-propeller fold protein YncE